MSSDSDEEELLLLYALSRKRKRENGQIPKKKRTRVWNANLEVRTNGGGEYHRLCDELSSNEDRFYHYFYMSQDSFEKLHEKLEPRISKLHTNFREPISTRERLIVCLRFLATGGSYGTIARSFRLGRTTISSIVRQTCREIYNVLQPEYLPEPTKEIWRESEKGFQDIWNFPNCVGILNGRHINIKCPAKHIHYDKKNSRIVLLCIIDPWCKFTAVDVGDYGPPDQNGLFEETPFYQKYVLNFNNILPSKPLPGTTILMPHVFIGDESFILHTNLLRRFPFSAVRLDSRKKIFNERLKQPYGIVDETFNMILRKWRFFKRQIEIDLDTTYVIIKAVCCLHNFIINEGDQEEDFEEVEEKPVRKKGRKKPKKAFMKHFPTNCRWKTEAAKVREMFMGYFNK